MTVPAPASPLLSKRQVNRAGDLLRDWWMNPNSRQLADSNELSESVRLVLFEFRPTFQRPLDKVVMGVRSMVRSSSPGLKGRSSIPVGQRLKRETQIIDKLARHPAMQLARMQDIGGCRAVLPGGASEVYAVVERMRKADWDIRGAIDDYIKRPTNDGYRAVHVVVMRDERLIEIQLRTPGQHEWAIAVERASIQLRMPLKFGVGEPVVLEYFKYAADAIALQENSAVPDEGFQARFDELREQVRPYFAKSRAQS
ncbi:MAG TPA: RelA/SpoT domain-containing protein [Solirubrobacteraceae bacterium]